MNLGNEPVEQRDLSIPREFDVVEKAVVAQHIVIDDLINRLMSVMRPPAPADDQNAVKADAPNLTEFGGRLRHIRDSVDVNTDRLRQIVELLEL